VAFNLYIASYFRYDALIKPDAETGFEF